MSLRVNRRVVDRDAYLGRLQAAGIAARPSPHSDCGVVLDQAAAVTDLPGFAEGEVSVQDIAAQQAAVLLDLAPGQRVLDACAAPGGKAGHILEREPALDELVALDADDARLARVRANFERLGHEATLVHADAADTGNWWDGRLFDRVLLDAPCTGTGVIRRHPDIKLLRRPEDVASLSGQQARLLDALWPLLGPGGKLVYVTCSVMPEENAGRIAQFLAAHEDARVLPVAPGWGLEQEIGRQILPGAEGMDGFFYAIVQKV
jgi:16S rRNA (cytosine967-C5)-methyltransferase